MAGERRKVGNPLRRAVILGLAAATWSVFCGSQTLARPGWAGSGLNGEPWWRNAVFYRVDPKTFQDSDSDGLGDLPGLTSRLDYLQTLGVDAVILASGTAGSAATQPTPGVAKAASAGPSNRTGVSPTPAPLPFAVLDEPGFDELLFEASRRHLRVVIAQPLSSDPSIFLARARLALTRGAAGVEVSPSLPGTPAASSLSLGAPAVATVTLADLRTLAAGFPGERIVVSDFDSTPIAAVAHAPRKGGALRLRGGDAPELDSLPLPDQSSGTPEALRSLVTEAESLPPGTAPLFRAPSHPEESPAGARPGTAHVLSLPAAAVLAVRLLSLRGALTLDAGQELGLPSTTPAVTPQAGAVSPAAAPVMQWTPRNLTPPSVKIETNPEPTPVPTRSDVYGAYRPYVPVKPKPVTLPGTPPPPPEPDSLPGFTSGALPFTPPAELDAAHRNVAVEDLDPRSLLNLYRRLIALHHGHATLRTGSTAVLDPGPANAMVWVRRAPAGARTVASVIVAFNLSDAPVALSLDAELARAHIRPGVLRPLLGTATTPNGPQSTARLSMPAHSVYVGELYHH